MNTEANTGAPLSDEAQRLLNEVDQTLPPEALPESTPETDAQDAGPVLTDEQADAISRELVKMVADTAEILLPALEGQYTADTRERVIERLTPVVKKYDGDLPPWLKKWHEEILLAVVLGGVVYGSVRAVLEYKPPPAATL